MVSFYQSDYGILWLSPWLGRKADELPTRRNGWVDMRYRKAKRFFHRLNRLAEARYMAGFADG